MLLAHSSGLPAYEKLFLKAKTRDDLLAAAFTTPLTADPGARAEYSDIGFIILGVALERIADETLDRFCQRELFGPLGMVHTAYNPPAAWRASIPPTADDRTFRHRIIQGEVQDENASVLGGVAGHAGLFATAEDLATFAHVLLQGGRPGSSRDSGALYPQGNRASRHFPSLGLGHAFRALAVRKIFLRPIPSDIWDTPEPRCGSIPSASFPITLLTNRTWPDCSNQAIKQVRPQISRCSGRSAGGQNRDREPEEKNG